MSYVYVTTCYAKYTRWEIGYGKFPRIYRSAFIVFLAGKRWNFNNCLAFFILFFFLFFFLNIFSCSTKTPYIKVEYASECVCRVDKVKFIIWGFSFIVIKIYAPHVNKWKLLEKNRWKIFKNIEEKCMCVLYWMSKER